jgi:hypothetical protein
MVRAFASAQLDDESTTADEDAAAAEALAAYRRGEGIGSDQMRAELGLRAEGDLQHRSGGRLALWSGPATLSIS